MCSRFVLDRETAYIREHFDVEAFSRDIEQILQLPRFNVAPTSTVPVIVQDGASRRLEAMRWGLAPAWSKEIKGPPLTNARAETVAEKPSFRSAFKRRRCLVPATGFYEWREEGGKQPYLAQPLGGGLFAFAGLWEEWKGPEGPVRSCAFVTTTPNATMAPIHDRMPVILSRDAEATWLDPTASLQDLQALLVPFTGPMVAYRVDRRVGNARFNDALCLEPLRELVAA